METIHYEAVQSLLSSADTWQLRGYLLEQVELRQFLAANGAAPDAAQGSPQDPPAVNCWGLHVVEGVYDGVLLDGLNALAVYESLPDRTDGRGVRSIYIDEQANLLQREALEAILSGQVGGGFSLLAPWVARRAGTRCEAFRWIDDGTRKSLSVGHVHASAVTVSAGQHRRAARVPLPGGSSVAPRPRKGPASRTLELRSDGPDVLLSNVFWHGSTNDCQ